MWVDGSLIFKSSRPDGLAFHQYEGASEVFTNNSILELLCPKYHSEKKGTMFEMGKFALFIDADKKLFVKTKLKRNMDILNFIYSYGIFIEWGVIENPKTFIWWTTQIWFTISNFNLTITRPLHQLPISFHKTSILLCIIFLLAYAIISTFFSHIFTEF